MNTPIGTEWSLEGDPLPPGSLHQGARIRLFQSPIHEHSRAGVLLIPGGGYARLAQHEGNGYALWFALHGIQAFVLDYRLPGEGHHHPAPLQDAIAAMQLLRDRAADLNLDPEKIAAAGSSAGGHLLGHLVQESSRKGGLQSARPNLAIFCYAITTLEEPTHAGSRDNLIPGASPDQLRELSPALNVNGDWPPCFILHGVGDPVVPVEHALLLATRLREARIAFELHCFDDPRHGQGMRGWLQWEPVLKAWLGKHGWLP